MVDYKIIVQDGSGSRLGEFEVFRNLSFGKKLNNFGVCTFEIPVTNAKASSLLALREYTVWIYRDGVLKWAGEQASREGNLVDSGDNWVTITSYTFLERLNSRVTALEKIYPLQDGSQIVWDLIQTTQADTNGSLGITSGTLAVTTSREKTYQNQNIMDAIISLANQSNGFDFELTDYNVLEISSFIGIDRSADIVLRWGVNIKSMRILEDFTKPATRAIVLGTTSTTTGGTGRYDDTDGTLSALYKLREYVYSQTEISDDSMFSATANAVLAKYGQPLLTVTLDIVRGQTPTVDQFALGDLIRMIIKTGIYTIDETFRIFEWNVLYNSDNTETVQLTLGNFRLAEGS